MDTTTNTPSTRKVRRDALGGKRGDGHTRTRRVRRPDPRTMALRPTDEPLTGMAGLVSFGAFVRTLGVDRELRERFFRLKASPHVVYPMEAQMRLLLDVAIAGEARVFGLEALAADPLFVHLAGGVVPSLDTVYRDLCRFDAPALVDLEGMVTKHGLALLGPRPPAIVHLDIDTTVEPLFGAQEGALPGPNPRYHGRPSYHPLLARLAEADAVIGAELRPGDTGLGEDAVPFIERQIERVHAVAPEAAIYVRIDAGADCVAIMNAIAARCAFFLIKARMTADLCGAVACVEDKAWRTVERDADGKPVKQVAEIPFWRKGWPNRGIRAVAVRTRDKLNGKQIYLWSDLDFTVQVFLTNEMAEAPEDLERRYNLRAGIEPLIGELKGGWACGKVPSQSFDANHAALLLKLLAFNLMRRFVEAHAPSLRPWRAAWIRRALVLVPGRMVRSGRRRTLRVPATSRLAPQRE